MANLITEFGKKPPAVRAGIIAAVIVALGALYYQLVYSGLRKDVQAANDSAAALVADEQKLVKEEQEYKQLSEKQEALERMIQENDTALPTAAQLPSFFDMLNRKVGEAGVDVLEWTYLKELQVEETIFKVPVQITLQGTFHELKKFFWLLYRMNQSDREAAAEEPGAPVEVEERDRILTIEDLHIRKPEMRNNELLLTATFRASTFRKEEPVVEEPADDKKKKAAAGSKNKVQQAKDKTEDAMDKSDDRARKAGGADSPVPAGGADRVKGGM